MNLFRSAFVIARRDFTATVMSKTFLFFLIGPLFPLLLGGVFGGIGAHVANQTKTPVVAVVGSSADFARLTQARDRFADATDETRTVVLVHFAPEANLAVQSKHLLALREPPVRAVLSGGLDHARLVGAVNSDGIVASQLRLILAAAKNPRAATGDDLSVSDRQASNASVSRDQTVTGQIGQMILFFLTILLSGMVLSQLIEEKSNKIIEVIAAAVPIDALFIGKLFAMLAASVIGIIVWVSAGALVIASLKDGGLSTLPVPAVGWPSFLLLTVVYFGMSYLLLGALFLTIGAQASTAREVQTMSMPVTFGQVLIFGFASTAVGAPNSALGLAAAIFPFSSPLVMVARAAEQANLWPHLLAILWQGAWIALILRLGARLFRRSVLKSGPSRRWWQRKAASS